MNKSKHEDNTVKSVIKAFAIIDALTETGEMSIGELSKALSFDKTTVHRLVNTIRAAGYIVQNENTKKYANSLKLFFSGQKLVEKMGLRDIARPFMKELKDITNETVSLGIDSGADVVYIDRIQSASVIKVGVDIGINVPYYCTGMGKAILAFKGKEEQETALSHTQFQKYAPNTVTDFEVLKRQLCEIKEKGYAKDDEEYVLGLVCIGAPIFNYDGEPVAAISVSCLALHSGDRDPETRYASTVKRMAETISAKLGHRQ